MRNPLKSLAYLAVLGCVLGFLGQGVLVLRDHCRSIEGLLVDDFRVVAFLKRGVDDDRRKVVEEKIRAVETTEDVSYFTPEESLARIERNDPGFSKSVALVGKNPLPGAFEVRLTAEGLSSVESWASEVLALPEIDDVRYKAVEAEAVLHVRYYARFLTLIVCFVVCLFASGTAGLAWTARENRIGPVELLGGPEEVLERSAAGGAGALAGMLAVSALAWPASGGALSAFPGLGFELLLLLLGAFAGAVFSGPVLKGRASARGRDSRAKGGRLVAAIVTAALVLSAPSARAASVAGKKKELSKVKEELKLKKKAYEENRRLERTLQRSLRQLRRSEDRTQSVLRRLETRRAKKDEERRALSERLAALDKAHGGGLELLSDELGAFRREEASQSSLYGTEDVWKGAFRRAAIKDKAVYLARLGTFRDATASKHLALDNESRILSARTSRTLSELLGQQQRIRRASKEYSTAKRTAEQTRAEIKELEESAKALASLIKKLQKSSKRPYKPTGTAPSFPRNSLPWPAEGTVATTFGKKRVEELQTWAISNGIEIAASPGAAVHPVAPGEVIYAGEFRSYGSVVIVDHGGGFVSIYGHLGRILRKAGDNVARGETIAAGSRDKRLYLELRYGQNAIDPLTWLEKR